MSEQGNFEHDEYDPRAVVDRWTAVWERTNAFAASVNIVPART